MNKKDKKKLVICIILFFAAMLVCTGIIMFSIVNNSIIHPEPEMNIAQMLKITVTFGLVFAACSTALGAFRSKSKSLRAF